MANIRRTGLGKGLDALFEDNHVEDKAIIELKISQIEPNKNQPRSSFDESALRELADSIRENGILQPLVVRPLENGSFQIVAGERRWRASRIAGLTDVPVIVKELSDSQTLEIAIIENLQREDLNPIELAMGYKTLMEEHSLTQEQVAQKLGKSRPVIANTVRLLALPDEVVDLIKAGEITTGHAKALLALEDNDLMVEIAKKTAGEKLLVRDVERLAKERKDSSKPDRLGKRSSPVGMNNWGKSYYKEVQMALESEFGRKVSLSGKDGKTTLSLDFYDQTELEDFVALITKKSEK